MTKFFHAKLSVTVHVGEFTQEQFERYVEAWQTPERNSRAANAAAILRAAIKSGWVTLDPPIVEADVAQAKPALVQWIVNGDPDLAERYTEATTIPPN